MVFDLKDDAYAYDLPSDRKDLLDLVLGAFRSIRAPVAYVSMPITSGKLLYEVLERKGCRNLGELALVDKNAVFNEIIKPNIEMGIVAADHVRTNLPPLAPSVFEAKRFRWSQDEYMALWLKVIEERAREMHMTDGWEYSNGGVKEFTRAMQMYHVVNMGSTRFKGLSDEDTSRLLADMSTIRVYDLRGKRLCLLEGNEAVGEAIADLERRGFDASSLRQSAKELKTIVDYLDDPLTPILEPDALAYHRRNGMSSEMIYVSRRPHLL